MEPLKNNESFHASCLAIDSTRDSNFCVLVSNTLDIIQKRILVVFLVLQVSCVLC